MGVLFITQPIPTPHPLCTPTRTLYGCFSFIHFSVGSAYTPHPAHFSRPQSVLQSVHLNGFYSPYPTPPTLPHSRSSRPALPRPALTPTRTFKWALSCALPVGLTLCAPIEVTVAHVMPIGWQLGSRFGVNCTWHKFLHFQIIILLIILLIIYMGADFQAGLIILDCPFCPNFFVKFLTLSNFFQKSQKKSHTI